MSADTDSRPILIEGWRFVPHSYAIVNQWQCLEMLRRGCRLAMRDVRYVDPRWKPVRGLLPAAAEAAVAGIGPLPASAQAASVLRLSIPVRLRPSPKGPTAVLCTADFGCIPRAMMENDTPLKEAIAGTDVRLITPSGWSRWGLLRSGVPPDRITIVPHGVATAVFRPVPAERRAAIRQRLGWADKFVFLNVSAMTISKGTDLLLKAFARAVRVDDDALLVLKGIDAIYDSSRFLERLTADIGGEERRRCRGKVQYLGRTLSFSLLAQVFQAADAYVSPYRTESFNLPVLEAIACGLPVICTSGGPTDDYTTPEVALRIESRLLPNPFREPEQVKLEPDADHLTSLMRQAMADRGLAETARRHGPALVASRFTWARVVDGLLAALPR